MSTHIAISVLGKDQPGIVAAISKLLYQNGCNIEDSSMTSLRCEFAMILIVELPRSISAKSLGDKLAAIAKKRGLSSSLRVLKDSESKPGRKKGEPFVISVHGADKPGIVFAVSDLLAKNGINITDVVTNIVGSGAKTAYIMFLEIDLPLHIPSQRFVTLLNELAAELSVTITLNPVDSPEL